jgi:hypothetical protein
VAATAGSATLTASPTAGGAAVSASGGAAALAVSLAVGSAAVAVAGGDATVTGGATLLYVGGATITVGALDAALTGGAPVTTGGSWYGLLAILQEARQIWAEERATPPTACPKCGEPLETARGVLRCRFDGWKYGAQTL